MPIEPSRKTVALDWESLVRAAFAESIAVKHALCEEGVEVIAAIARRCADAIAEGHKLLLCGNGGSAADAQHLAAELLVRLRPNVNRQALPAIALALDASTITACGNDYGFETLYERMLDALGQPGDVLIGITTSGKSPNVLRALQRARDLGICTIGLLGAGGGPALQLCDLALVVPSNITARIQEAHITVGHIVMELVEEHLGVRSMLRIAAEE
jgi:D-sedoheptulose 7-phosphate isomerase